MIISEKTNFFYLQFLREVKRKDYLKATNEMSHLSGKNKDK
jgi:hypothetical protein